MSLHSKLLKKILVHKDGPLIFSRHPFSRHPFSRHPFSRHPFSTHPALDRAQSGTGKTATFAIAILQKIDIQLRETQALVLSPTRELATQIQKVVLALGDYMSIQCHSCIGGTNVGEDIRKLDYGQHVVSGTPGRVFGGWVWGVLTSLTHPIPPPPPPARHDQEEKFEDT